MMKKVKILGIIFSLVTLSCEQEPQGMLKLSTESEKMSSAGGVIDLTVEANYRWTCNTGTTDVMISSKSGDAGTSNITVTVPGNPTEQTRNIQIKFNCENAKSILNVDQKGSRFDTLVFKHNSYYFPAIQFDGQGHTGNINWGDGKNADYSCFAPIPEHEYDKAADYTVTISTHDTDGFYAETMKGICRIDLTKF